MTIKQILKQGNPKELIALFNFTPETSDDKILVKFNLWGRHFFHKYFESEDASFHTEMILNLIHAYKGDIETFINIAFRGAGKDVKTKLFIAFCILNDTTHFRKFYKVLSADLTNAKQLCTDVYNMLIQPRILNLYPDTFIKSEFKREEQWVLLLLQLVLKLCQILSVQSNVEPFRRRLDPTSSSLTILNHAKH